MKRLIIIVAAAVVCQLSARAADSYGQINAQAFGAKGNGTADDTAAIQKLFQQTKGSGYFIPAGIYKCTADIVLPRFGIVFGNGTRLNDATMSTIVFTDGHGFTHSYDGDDHEFDHFQMRDLAIYGQGTTGTLLKFKNSHEFELKNLRVYGAAIGLSIENSWDYVINNVQCGAASVAGHKLITLVTDGTYINAQFSNNNGYGVWADTALPQNIQLIRFYGGSLQYNKNGNWFNGGIELILDNIHFEGNLGSDVVFGSATNKCENVFLRGNHYDWSDNQYNNATNLWPGSTPAYYQIDVQNAWHFYSDDGHKNVSATQAKNRACIYVSERCRDVTLSGASSYLTPYAISKIRLNRSNNNRNLLLNGLMTRDERNPNNYPYTWISDYPYPDISFSSQTVPGLLGYSFSGNLTNGRSLYVTNTFSLATNTVYTYTTLMKSGAGQRVMQRLVDRSQWNGGSNDVYQTANIITNTGGYLWVVSRFNCVDQYHTDPYLFTTCVEPGKQVVEVGDVSFSEGYGVGAPQAEDNYNGIATVLPTMASQIPNQGTWPTGWFMRNDGSVVTNVSGWLCTSGGTPGNWSSIGGAGFVAGTPGYIPTWATSGTSTLSATSRIFQDAANNVIIATNDYATLDVNGIVRSHASGGSRPRMVLLHDTWGDWTWYMSADGSLSLLNTGETTPVWTVSQTGVQSISGDLAVTGTIAAPLLSLSALNTGTLVATNGVIYKTALAGPAAATIGAGNGALWLSNSIYLYKRTTADGISATDTLIP